MKGFRSPGFIVGVGRSGTTLLAAILNRHPLVHVTPETDFFHRVFAYPGGAEGFAAKWPDSLRQIAARTHDSRDYDAQQTAEEVIARLGNRWPTLSTTFSTLGGILASRAGKPLWIEKTPTHVHYLKEIRTLYPEAPIIHLVRDGRGVAESRSRMPYLKNRAKDYYNNLLAWVQAVGAAHAILVRDPHAFELRYEDLVTAPEERVRALCSFLGIEFRDRMLQPDGSEAGLVEVRANHKAGISRSIDTALVSQWRKVLPGAVQVTSAVLAGDELTKWGYETPTRTGEGVGRVYLTGDFFRTRWRDAILSVLEQVDAAGRPFRLGGFVRLDERGAQEASVDTTPPLCLPLTPLTAGMTGRHDLLVTAAPLPDSGRSATADYLALLRLSRKLRTASVSGTKLISLYAGNFDQTRHWRYARTVERLFARRAWVIVCGCHDPAQCEASHLLQARRIPVLHLPKDAPVLGNLLKTI